MATFDMGALMVQARLAEEQFIVNAPLNPEPASDGLGIADIAAAVQPVIAKLNAFIVARPGAIRAARTILGELNRQGFGWAGDLDAILAAAPGALTTADRDLPMAISLLKEIAPAPTGITGEDPNDHNIKDH